MFDYKPNYFQCSLAFLKSSLLCAYNLFNGIQILMGYLMPEFD